MQTKRDGGLFSSMEQFEKYIKGLSNSKLNKKLKEYEQNAEVLGKDLPKVDKDEREMLMKEYNTALVHIDQIKEEIKRRKDKKANKEASTIETLFPTVTKIIEDHKAPEDEIKEENEIKEEDNFKDVTKSQTTDKQENTDDYTDIAELTKDTLMSDNDEESIFSLKDKNDRSILPDSDEFIVENINDLNNKNAIVISDDVEDRDMLSNKVKVKPRKAKTKEMTKPVRPTTVLQEIKADGTVETVTIGSNDLFIDDLLSMDEIPEGDKKTTILSTTKEDIIYKAIEVFSSDYINKLSKEDLERDLTIAIDSRDIIKNKLKEKLIDSDLEKALLDKLDILDKNINKLKAKQKTF